MVSLDDTRLSEVFVVKKYVLVEAVNTHAIHHNFDASIGLSNFVRLGIKTRGKKKKVNPVNVVVLMNLAKTRFGPNRPAADLEGNVEFDF